MKSQGRFSVDDDELDDFPTYQPTGRALRTAAASTSSAASTAQPKGGAGGLTAVAHTSTGALSAKSSSKDDFEIDNFGAGYKASQPAASVPTSSYQEIAGAVSSEQMEMSRRWLMRPCFRGDPPLYCYIERDKSGFNMMSPVYKMFIEVGTDGSVPARFAMSAKKKVSNRTSYYLVSLDQTPSTDDRGAESILGKIRGNQVGSQYTFTVSY